MKNNSWEHITQVYLLGIGGIGMSALARYFHAQGKQVSGYDRTCSDLTQALNAMGIEVHYEDDVRNIPQSVLENKQQSLIIYTPAIPKDHAEYTYLLSESYSILKRAKALGYITNKKQGLCVAGTHGKTTTSTLLAHLLQQTPNGCSAFLGGISANYKTNLLLSKASDLVVIEADEYDRSFLQLTPSSAIITSVDADHLDIYHEKEHLIASFQEFSSLIKSDGHLVVRKNLAFVPQCDPSVKIYEYALDEVCDFYTSNIRNENGLYIFTLNTPWGSIEEVQLGMPGLINVENAVAASALALIYGATMSEVKLGLASFMGISRRFEYVLRTEKLTVIDDYAHHPMEIKAVIRSVRDLYPTKKITGVFQPHLYSRTKDFAADFASSLSALDQLFLLDIYPARELPMEGVTSSIIFNQVKTKTKVLCTRETLEAKMHEDQHEIILFMGAGDISLLVAPITKSFVIEHD